jgi:hypothetical protein
VAPVAQDGSNRAFTPPADRSGHLARIFPTGSSHPGMAKPGQTLPSYILSCLALPYTLGAADRIDIRRNISPVFLGPSSRLSLPRVPFPTTSSPSSCNSDTQTPLASPSCSIFTSCWKSYCIGCRSRYLKVLSL